MKVRCGSSLDKGQQKSIVGGGREFKVDRAQDQQSELKKVRPLTLKAR